MNEIIRRAKAINVPLVSLFAAVKLTPSTWYRWQNAEVDPGYGRVGKACQRLENELALREKNMAERLINSFGGNASVEANQ